MRFAYKCEKVALNVYKLSHNTHGKLVNGVNKGKSVFRFQKVLNGNIYYKEFYNKKDAINYAIKINSIIEKALKTCLQKITKKHLKQCIIKNI